MWRLLCKLKEKRKYSKFYFKFSLTGLWFGSVSWTTETDLNQRTLQTEQNWTELIGLVQFFGLTWKMHTPIWEFKSMLLSCYDHSSNLTLKIRWYFKLTKLGTMLSKATHSCASMMSAGRIYVVLVGPWNSKGFQMFPYLTTSVPPPQPADFQKFPYLTSTSYASRSHSLRTKASFILDHRTIAFSSWKLSTIDMDWHFSNISNLITSKPDKPHAWGLVPRISL